MKVSWSHTVLRVRDLEPMIEFYRDMLGFQVSDRGPLGPDGPEIVFMSGDPSDHHQFALLPVRTDSPESSLEHNAFRVDTVADVKTMFDTVSNDPRCSRIMPLTHGNAVSVYFNDPEGNTIEVFADTPWHVRQPQARVWDPSLGADELLAWVESEFRNEPEFGPMDEYRARMAQRLEEV
ncbi:MAG: VOC family protein [Acidimicrobiales bacterium]|nr:VOC family protein [Acidimicrobiales bacterium]